MKFQYFVFIDKIIKSINKQFPKQCSCGFIFYDVIDFIENTTLPADQNLMICNEHVYEILDLRNCNQCHSTRSIKYLLNNQDKKILLRYIYEDIEKYQMNEDVFLQMFRDTVFNKIKETHNDKQKYYNIKILDNRI
ncbi:hypothetical protein DEFDS_P122 (plasmid) [Deferribacter desulfuricans SSM1]|uniref:Uncharacterized protein n=1 Tax=Deferribacter desulfuricans (strain DSM 14783 / JCM 11476 / NBRC 101012 / SSM1) TaxID=639282 RepID=D3PEV2_DEFDS|nr:hypothetical protein [Deferribacter desulfuricans]BAI81744.1 hypothetical protein DEFDS_P122 [Deferribacter desulfuricans SSM1]